MEITETSRLPGPNRRSEQSILEYRLSFRPGFAELSTADDGALQQAIHSRLLQLGAGHEVDSGPGPPPGETWPERVARHFARLALWLQQQAGHAVSECGTHPDSEDPAIWVWFEYDHVEVGQRAARLALAWVRDALNLPADGADGTTADSPSPGQRLPGQPLPGPEQLAEFLAFSRHLPLPAETQALIAAARRRDIPSFKLDRYPYDPLVGNFRIRPNGLLRLGHARHSLVLDGTLCVNWNPAQTARLQQRRAMFAALQAAGIPVTAEAAGIKLQVLVIGSQLVAAMRDGAIIEDSEVPGETLQQIDAVHRSFRLPIFAASIVTGGAWANLDLAPHLERWFPEGGAALDMAADLLLQQLYPNGSTYRVPIISVTGTNGKTTTCTMLSNIMQGAGRTPVLVCSNGVYVGDQNQGSRLEIGPAATWYALESSVAEVAVLEDYFGSICRFGFAYEWCDVAVCTNVTVDHLHKLGVHTLEQMAEVKFSVIARARNGAVLNADNGYCAAMLARSTAAKKVAVSLTRDRATLAAEHPYVQHFCVLESEAGRDFITLYDGASRLPIVAVNDIPATRQGMAKHNTSNAMHAASAAWLLGVEQADIAAALQAFASDFRTCPGRLNEFPGLPFRVIMDYAHNADGFRQISAFVDAQKVNGRKRVMFSFSEDRRPGEIRQAVRELAGHFDLYTCGKFRDPREIVTENIQATLHQALLQSGVSADAINLAADSQAAISHVLGQAEPGDLVMLLVGSSEFERLWQRLETMRSGQVAQSASQAIS